MVINSRWCIGDGSDTGAPTAEQPPVLLALTRNVFSFLQILFVSLALGFIGRYVQAFYRRRVWPGDRLQAICTEPSEFLAIKVAFRDHL